MKNLFVFIFAVVLAVGAGAQSATVTFNVNMSEQTVAESGVYLGGGVMGGHDAYQLTDDDGDGIQRISRPCDWDNRKLHFPKWQLF